MKYDIFISYRRSSYETANLIATKLKTAGYSVFLDIDSLGPGKYNEQLNDVIDNCKDFILVLHPDSLERCKNNEDYVQIEICRAIEKNKNIIPLLINGFIWPTNMPKGLEELPKYQSLHINTVEYFDMTMGILQKRYLKSKSRKHRMLIWVIIIAILGAIISTISIINYYNNIASNEPQYPKYDILSLNNYADFVALTESDSLLLGNIEFEQIFNNATSGVSDAQFDLGNICYELEYYNDALHWFSESAKRGNARAANGLGKCYYNAKGVTRSPREALKWFLKSAEGNCPEGMNNAGKCYFEGFGINIPNTKKALTYYQKAANARYAPAQYNLGVMYFFGQGTKTDIDKGLEWLNRAAYNNSPKARLILGNIYNKGFAHINKNDSIALKWYKGAINCENFDPEVSKEAYKKINNILNK